MSKPESYSPNDRLIFYSLAERKKLIDMLNESGNKDHNSQAKQGKSLRSKVSKIPANAVVKRHIMDLDCAARDALAEFIEWRAGKLNESIQLGKKLGMKSKGLVPRFEKLISEFKPVLENYGPDLHKDAHDLLDRFRAAARSYKKAYGKAPQGIKSEGYHHSLHLANACLNDFLVVVCVTWHQATSRPIGAGSSEGPFGRFATAAVMPLAIAMSHHIPGLNPNDWASWPRLADRIASREIQKHDLLISATDGPAVAQPDLEQSAEEIPKQQI